MEIVKGKFVRYTMERVLCLKVFLEDAMFVGARPGGKNSTSAADPGRTGGCHTREVRDVTCVFTPRPRARPFQHTAGRSSQLETYRHSHNGNSVRYGSHLVYAMPGSSGDWEVSLSGRLRTNHMQGTRLRSPKYESTSAGLPHVPTGRPKSHHTALQRSTVSTTGTCSTAKGFRLARGHHCCAEARLRV